MIQNDFEQPESPAETTNAGVEARRKFLKLGAYTAYTAPMLLAVLSSQAAAQDSCIESGECLPVGG